MTTALPLQIRVRITKLVAVLAALVLLSGGLTTQAGSTQGVAAINASVATYLATHSLGSVSLIVETKGDPAEVEALIRQNGGAVDRQFGLLNAFVATLNPSLAMRLNHDPRVLRLNLNAPVKWLGAVDTSHLANRYDAISRVPNAWNAGLDGSEVQVATIDTGAWPHDDLVKAAPGVPSNKGNRLLTVTTNAHATDAYDHYGHGTHVAGIISGNGYDSGGQYIGVAPNSLLVAVKVSDDLGNANEGDVINGLEWVYQANRHGFHIRAVNLSVASTVAQSFQQSTLDAEVEKLWLSGVTVVAAAGNGTGTVQYAPGNDPFVITVGSIDDNYQTSLAASPMASWALYGRTQDGFNKPEVVADGSHVVSLLAPASALSVQHPTNIIGGSYFKMGGTSMAAPQVVGMAALMLQNNPSMSNGRIKRALRHSSVRFGNTAYTSWLGTNGGFVDVNAVGDLDNNDDTAGLTVSQSFDPGTGNILAAGSWYGSATFPGAPWDSISWNSISWNSISWNSISWNNADGNTPILVSPASISWNSISWNSISWNSISWNSISWNSISWNSISWNDSNWMDGSFS